MSKMQKRGNNSDPKIRLLIHYTDAIIVFIFAICISFLSNNELFIGMVWGSLISLLYGKTKQLKNGR